MEKRFTTSGAKAHQRADTEWRLQEYSDWHHTLDNSLLMADVDLSSGACGTRTSSPWVSWKRLVLMRERV